MNKQGIASQKDYGKPRLEGSKRCACGKTISANKDQCFACREQKKAA